MSELKQTVVCIAGMHRSGTSMITRLLNLCGMDLGPESDLMPPSPANPEGYWEHIWFNYYNNQILNQFRGAWDMVPIYPEKWEYSEEVAWARQEAAAKIAAFKTPIWGWKDPRNSITLPFWKSMLPQMKTVVCLRNPLDVANSLNKRGSGSVSFGLQLWWQYNSMILLSTSPRERLVTHFDPYFGRGAQELHRLAESLGMRPSEDAIAEACKFANSELRHSVTNLDKLAEVAREPGLVETYCKLLSESGQVARELFAAEWDKILEHADRWTPQSCSQPTLFSGTVLQSQIKTLKEQLAAAQAEARQTADSAQKQIVELRAHLDRVHAALAQISAQRDEATLRLNDVLVENNAIKNSKTWKLLTRAGSIGVKTGLVRSAAK